MSAYKVFFAGRSHRVGDIGRFAEADDIVSAAVIADSGQKAFQNISHIWIECDGEVVERRALVELSPGSEKIWIRQSGETSVIMDQKP